MKRMLKMTLPSERNRGRPKRRSTDVREKGALNGTSRISRKEEKLLLLLLLSLNLTVPFIKGRYGFIPVSTLGMALLVILLKLIQLKIFDSFLCYAQPEILLIHSSLTGWS